MRRSLDAPLGDQLRQVLARAHEAKWTITRTNGNSNYVATSPKGNSVTFGKGSGRGNVYAQFRRAGLEVDPKRIFQPRFRGRTEGIDENGPFASLSFLLDEVRQLPLIDIPESVQRRWEFTNHALERINERSIGIFEVWAALHEPAFRIPELDRVDVVHYLRGDVEVIVSDTFARILTVVDMLETTRTEPRVALAPQVTIPAPREEITVPSSKPEEPAFIQPGDQPETEPTDTESAPPETESAPRGSRVAALRKWLNANPINTEFTVAEAVAATGLSTQTVMTNFSTWTGKGALDHVDVGRYRLLSKSKLEPTKPSERKRPGAEASKAANPPARIVDRMRALIAADPVGTEYTNRKLAQALGCSPPAVSGSVDSLVNDGTLTKSVQTGAWLYTKVGSAVPQQRRGLFPAPVQHRTKAKKVTTPASTSDEDYDVTVGFSVESLPRSDLWDLIDVVGYHLHELEANPGTWARVATYSGATAHEVASKRAGKLEAELRNPRLHFQVRRISQAEVGLFICWQQSG